MTRHSTRALTTMALLTSTVLAAGPAVAAEVTPDRLVNADKEPQNWLMNHRTYDGQRFSPLGRINKDNVKNLRLAYAVALGGGASNATAAPPCGEISSSPAPASRRRGSSPPTRKTAGWCGKRRFRIPRT